jgi:hypothetical protein
LPRSIGGSQARWTHRRGLRRSGDCWQRILLGNKGVVQYKPTKADLAFRDAEAADADIFTQAKLLQKVSDEYLIVMAHDNTDEHRAPFKAMIDAEAARRGDFPSRRANHIAILSLVVSIVALVFSTIAAFSGE